MEKKQANDAGQAPKASSQDVLGSPQSTEKVDPQWEKYYRKLRKARDSFSFRQRDQLSQAAEDSTPPQRNLADIGTDEYDREFALSMASADQNTLLEIEHALDRIRSGTYGVCELTGKTIEPERLDAIPWTRFSAEAERQLEAEGQVQTTKLGERQTVPKENPAASRE